MYRTGFELSKIYVSYGVFQSTIKLSSYSTNTEFLKGAGGFDDAMVNDVD